MAKKSLIIFSLIISILALFYMFISYYGILRYFNMHIDSTGMYVEKYRNIPKSRDRIVVSFTANKEQLEKIKPFLNSILDQTTRVDDIALTIPYSDMKTVLVTLKDIVTVYGYNKDYGDTGSLIPTVLREPESNTRIILVDPTMVYGKEFIADMIDASTESPDKIIYGKDNEIRYGVLIKPKFFDDKISDYKNTSSRECCKFISECSKNSSTCVGKNNTYRRMK